MKIESMVAVGFCMTALAGCGVTLEAVRVVGTDPERPTPSFIPGSGIVYALPRTDFEVVQPIKLKVQTGGPLKDMFDDCRRACKANSSTAAKACTFNASPKLIYQLPEVRAVPRPDLTRLYQVSPAADLFQTLDFKFAIKSDGVLEKADSKASNMAYEVISSAAIAAAKIAGSVLAAPAPPSLATASKLRSLAPDSEHGSPAIATASSSAQTCYDTSVEVDALASSGKDEVLTCTLLRAIQSCLAPFDKVVDTERTSLGDLYDHAASSKIDVKLLDALAANRRERIDAAVAKRAEAASAYGLAESKSKEALFQVLLPMEGPLEFEDATRKMPLGPLIMDGHAHIVGVSDNASEMFEELKKLLGADTRVYEFVTKMPAHVKTTIGDERAVVGGGYKFRVPTQAITTLTVHKGDVGKPIYGPIVERKLVAQYGPVGSLPSNFKGKGGRVMVTLWPDSGGLQAVEIGADAIPSSAVTDVIDESVTQVKARQDKAAVAAAAAAAADPELDNLTRQKKLLTLQKEIKELQDALGK